MNDRLLFMSIEEVFVLLLNGEEVNIHGSKSLSQRFAPFRDPEICRHHRATLTNPTLDVDTARLFFSMALNEAAFSVIPCGATPEDTRTRNGLSILARHFGFTELTSELEKRFSPQSERFLDTFRRLHSRNDHLVKRFDEAILSDDINDFLQDYDPSELNTIVKSALSDPHIRRQPEVHSGLASYLLRKLREDSSYATIFEHLDFSMLRQYQIKELFGLMTFDPCLIGNSNFKTVVDSILALQSRIFEVEQDIDFQIVRHVKSVISGGETLGPFKEDIAKLKEHILRTTVVERDVSSLKSKLDGLTAVANDSVRLDSRFVFTNSSWSRHYQHDLIVAAGKSIGVASNPKLVPKSG
jgi:hypothetical protein